MLLLKNLLFTLVMPGTAAVYIPLLIARDRAASTGMPAILGVSVLVVGAAIYAWCVWDFATFGRGTPAPIDAPKRLVVRGLYRHARNPMYVGVLSVTLGWAILFRSSAILLYAAALWTGFHTFVVSYEEPHLRSIFGNEYERYCASVGRWLPRLG
jgi:protein-S-isoprenylcysteine O-methyltransferase Ste14